MNKHLLAFGLLPALALAGCGGNSDTTTTTDVTTDNMMATGTVPPFGTDNAMMTGEAATPAQDFVNTVAASDSYEVQAGQLAKDKAASQALKDFGAMMVEDHGKSTKNLMAAAAQANPPLTPDPALTAEQEANLAALRAASGDAFDSAYKTQQVAAHEKALALLKDQAANGEAASLKTFAGDTAKVVETHLDKIKAM